MPKVALLQQFFSPLLETQLSDGFLEISQLLVLLN